MGLYEDLQNAGLPVAIEDGTITLTRSLTEVESETLHDILDPSRVTKRQEAQASLQQLKDEYQTAITTLQTHENFTSPTNAQVINAVKFHAKVLRLTLKLIARNILNT